MGDLSDSDLRDTYKWYDVLVDFSDLISSQALNLRGISVSIINMGPYVNGLAMYDYKVTPQ